MSISKFEVKPDRLRVECDPNIFKFKCTKDLAPLREFIGQNRAIRGIEFGLSMKLKGYNIYVSGLSGTGKNSIVKTYVNKIVEKRKAEGAYHPDDWCYLYNFFDADKPCIVHLPQGKARKFKTQMEQLQIKLKEELTKAFSNEEYKNNSKATVQQGQTEQQKLFSTIAEEARSKGILLQMSQTGPTIVPLLDGKPVSEEQYRELDEKTRKKMEKARDEIALKLQDVFEKARETEKKVMEKLQNTDKAIANFTVSRLFDELKKTYKDAEEIITFLDELKNYTLENLDIFKEKQETPSVLSALGMPAQPTARTDPFLPFQINVFVDNTDTKGPPVITESNPNYINMFGQIERRFIMGGYVSDHTMIKSGALQRANGGYLIMSANDVIMNPGVWNTLKRSLKDKEARIEEPYEQFGLFAPQGLRPQPMPIDVKIILIGDPNLYQLLSAYDEDFFEIFRVKSDFDTRVERTRDNMLGFAAFISGCCEECEIKHFDREGVASIIDYASRMVGDQTKLSSRFAQIKELVEEAGYWAQQNNHGYVTKEHVLKAIEERRFRHNLPDERLREAITDGTIMIDTEGEVVGQVNGLSVYSMGDISFGKPSRITCRTFLGRSGVINIERESKMSGSIHDKGVMILSGFLGWKFAQDIPLSLSASLCFEQSYGGIDGDSASSTELYAILSSLAELPIKQGIAVTGSVNQKGEVQPIGGVNQKIEGFFEICQAKGLTGEQGVMIPKTNLKHLMLRDDVVAAVKEGKFHIWAVETIDEGIEVLTGVKAGNKRKNGTYPPGTINRLVSQKLADMADRLKTYSSGNNSRKQDK